MRLVVLGKMLKLKKIPKKNDTKEAGKKNGFDIQYGSHIFFGYLPVSLRYNCLPPVLLTSPIVY